jgi:hypothetical protein
MTPAAPPHAYPPAPPAPPPPEHREPLPVYFAVGVGATFLDGDASRNVPMSSVFSSTQAHISGETALRLSPAFALGLYADAGGGDPSGVIRDQCRVIGNDCMATAARVGFLVRHTWEPLSRRPVWLTLGTGWELGQITIDHHSSGTGHDELLTYTGREYLRVGAGVDFRPNHVLGFGLYGSFGFGAYNTLKDPTQSASLDRSNHTTAQVGIRLILFP